MFELVQVGAVGECSLLVGKEHTAARWGSGSLLVLSTSQMIALMEGAAVEAVDPLLPSGYQTVGVHVSADHLAATPLACKVTARAELVEIDKRRLVFRVEAHDDPGTVGKGTHQCFIVDTERFMEKAASRAG